MIPRPRAVVAGLICLDIIPRLEGLTPEQFQANFRPGRMLIVGDALLSTGGSVSNTGLALHILGIPTRLIGKVGADRFGQTIRQIVAGYAPELADGMVVDPAASTSYTVVINPPGRDRMFLHNPGANNTFCARDVDYALLAEADLFHFGYPPVMERMFQNEGVELAELFRRAKETGVITSLDTTFPDPTSPGGKADWRLIFKRTLPFVDVFLPSIEEVLFMIYRPLYEQLTAQVSDGNILPLVTAELLSRVSQELMEMGARIVVLKLGDRGLYLRTVGKEALNQAGLASRMAMGGGSHREDEAIEARRSWANQELWAPCFQVQVVGTTGSGDATIAGFLSGLLRGLPPHAAMTAAVAVGACNVEAADALSGLRSWEATRHRIEAGWERHVLALDSPGGKNPLGWHWDAARQVWVGPAGD